MRDKRNSFLCFAPINNVTLNVKGFRGKMSTPRGPERLGQLPPRNAKRARLAVFDKIGNLFTLTYSQMIVQQFRQLNVYCRHLYFMKTGHVINCCVFKTCECSMFMLVYVCAYMCVCVCVCVFICLRLCVQMNDCPCLCMWSAMVCPCVCALCLAFSFGFMPKSPN